MAILRQFFQHLICPDCSCRLEFKDHLECPICKRKFPFDDQKIILLPSNLSPKDIAEERFWATDRREGKNAPAWIALVMKKDSLLYFYEEVLPNLRLHGRILEIGSGSCWLSALIKLQFPQIQVFASDVSISALDKGMQISELLRSKIDCFVACKAEKIPFENEFFDFVIGSAILHHTNPRLVTKEIFRVLKKNGQYIGIGELATPGIFELLWKRVVRRRKEVGLEVRNYSLSQWKRLFAEAGFDRASFTFEKKLNTNNTIGL
jgi:SAM-dependent methyltransferase